MHPSNAIWAQVCGTATRIVLIAVALTACNPEANIEQHGSVATESQVPTDTFKQSTNTPRALDPVIRTPFEPSSRTGDPYCNPSETEIWLIPSTTSVRVGEPLHVDLQLHNPASSGVFMGQIQYRLEILPDLFVGELVTESDKTLYPGESDTVSFELFTTFEGSADLTAKASYELHAVDLSWGSWTGCTSYPLKIEVQTDEGVPTATDTSIRVHEPSTRTGIPSVDIVLDAVIAGDQAAINKLIRFNVSACTDVMGLGGPPKCREGEPGGTQVEVLPFLGPEGHFLRRDDIGDWLGLDVNGLYAVYLVAEKAFSDPDYPAGQYAVVFVDSHGESFVTLQIKDGGIVRIDYILGYPPEEQLMRDASRVITPPLSQ